MPHDPLFRIGESVKHFEGKYREVPPPDDQQYFPNRGGFWAQLTQEDHYTVGKYQWRQMFPTEFSEEDYGALEFQTGYRECTTFDGDDYAVEANGCTEIILGQTVWMVPSGHGYFVFQLPFMGVVEAIITSPIGPISSPTPPSAMTVTVKNLLPNSPTYNNGEQDIVANNHMNTEIGSDAEASPVKIYLIYNVFWKRWLITAEACAGFA